MGHSTHIPTPGNAGASTAAVDVGTSASMALEVDGQQIQPTWPTINLIIDGVEVQPIPKQNIPSSEDATTATAAADEYPSAPPLQLDPTFIQPMFQGQAQGDDQTVSSIPLGDVQQGVLVQSPTQVTIVKANYRRRRCVIATTVVIVIVLAVSLGVGIGVGTRRKGERYSYSGYIVSKDYSFDTTTNDDICVTFKNTGDYAKFRVEIRSSFGSSYIASAETGYVLSYNNKRECVDLTSTWEMESQYTIVLDVYSSSGWKEVDRETFQPTNYPPPPPPPAKSFSGYLVSQEYDKDTYSNDDICVQFKNTGDLALFRVEIRSGSGLTFIASDETGQVSADAIKQICVELTSSWENDSKYTIVLDVYTNSGWDEVDREPFYP